jgi:hypothetical protein
LSLPSAANSSFAVTARFCTLFDVKYLARGLAMISSIMPYLRHDDEIVVLAMDDTTEGVLHKLKNERLRVVRIESLEDAELLGLQAQRPAREFCWTCTPALAHWMVNTSSEGEFVVYLDADLLFFGDPRVLLAELFGGGNVLVHEHRFSPDRAHYQATSGRFNVGLVAFRVGAEARTCVERWRAQTLERCELDPENGHCGDQGYLNEWPSLYSGLRILKNIGGGVAPWNVNQYRVGKKGRLPTVNEQPVVFYHYHAIERVVEPRFNLVALNPANGYTFPPQTNKIFYKPYAREIAKAERTMVANGLTVSSDRDRPCRWLDFMRAVYRRGEYIRVS